MPQFTINIPSDKVAMVGRAFGVVQGQHDIKETPEQAWERLKEVLVCQLQNKFSSTHKRELIQETLDTDVNNAITLV